MSTTNPFIYGNPLTDPRRFIGRRAEVEHIFSRLRNPEFESSSLIGERRMGKTSVLNFISHPDTVRRNGPRFESSSHTATSSASGSAFTHPA